MQVKGAEKYKSMSLRTLFLCAQGSSRAYLAASLLQAIAGDRFDAWAMPVQEPQSLRLAHLVLQEQQVAPLLTDHLVQPFFGLHWDLGIVLCNGATDA
jgi:hypothetical protein